MGSKVALAFPLLLKLCLVSAWNLPPTQFLAQFATKHDRNQLSISVPFGIPSKPLNTYFHQVDNIPTSLTFIDHEVHNMSVSRNPQDLFVIVPHESNIDGHIEKIIGWFNQRKRSNKEFWLLDITALKSTHLAKDKLKNLKLDLDDDLFWFEHTKNGIELYEVYRIHEDFDITVKPYGFWSVEDGLTTPAQEKWTRRQNMEEAKLKVMTLVSKPYITALIPSGPDQFEMEGMFAEVFFALQKILNFTFVLTKPPDEQWGAIQSDGTWTGMVRELQDQRADIAATDFTVTIARSNVITFAQPITQVYNSLFIKNPVGSFNFKAYIEPLKYLSWFFVGLFCILVPTFLFFTTKFGNEPMKSEFTWGKSQVFVLSALTMRGWSVSPNQSSSRCVFIVIMFAAVLIYYYWEAMLISYLATRFIVLPFTNMRGLIENSGFKIAIIPGTSYENAFKYSTDPIWQKGYKERIEPNLDDYAPYYKRMMALPLKDESLALYQNFFKGSYDPAYKSCQVIVIPAKYNFQPYAYGFQKDSPYLGLFNHYIKELGEKGALKQILNKYETGTQVCPDESGKPLGFESVFTAFLALLSGFLMGLVLFVVENIPRIMNCSIPFLDAYDKGNFTNQDVEGYEDQRQQDLILDLARKNAAIQSLQAKCYELQRKLNQSKSWYTK